MLMQYHILTIFPEIFSSFLSTSLLAKAEDAGHIAVSLLNPRDYCTDPHRQIDDMPYGGGAGMLLKAEPVIAALRSIQRTGEKRKIVFLRPSQQQFVQQTAHDRAACDDLVLICGRYEGIDHRVHLRCEKTYGEQYTTCSLGQYVTLGGEVPAMTIIEATARLLPGVIKETASRQDESYRPEQ